MANALRPFHPTEGTMPITVWIEKERRRVEAVVSGSFTTEEILGAIDRVAGDPAFEPGYDIFSDHTLVEVPIIKEQLQTLVDHLMDLRDRFGGARWAIVTERPASYGMMRMLAVRAAAVPIEVKVFRSGEEAEEWLAFPRGKR